MSFRGTTNKLVGWKEDLNMSFMPTIPAQRRALSYLTRQIHRHPGTYYLTGHSKGGSLAIYAFDNLPQPLADQIAHVYSFDGPSGVHSIPTTVIASPNSFPKVHSLGSVSIRQLTLKLLKVTSNFSASMTSSPGISLTILSPGCQRPLGYRAIFRKLLRYGWRVWTPKRPPSPLTPYTPCFEAATPSP